MHRQGLEGRLQNHFAFLTSEYGSTKNWFAIEHENQRNTGVYFFPALLTFKMIELDVRDNRMHSNGLEGRP